MAMAGTTGTEWRELALDECGAVAIPTSPTTCKLSAGDGGMAEDQRSERNKVPGGCAALGTASMEHHAAGLCRIGTVMGWPDVRSVWCGAMKWTGRSRVHENGVLGAKSLGERVGPHAVGPEGNTFPTTEFLPLVEENRINERQSIRLTTP